MEEAGLDKKIMRGAREFREEFGFGRLNADYCGFESLKKRGILVRMK